MDNFTIGLLATVAWIGLTLISWAFECHTNNDRGVSWGFVLGSAIVGPPIMLALAFFIAVIGPFAAVAWLLDKARIAIVKKYPAIPEKLSMPRFKAPSWFGRMAFRCPVPRARALQKGDGQ